MIMSREDIQLNKMKTNMVLKNSEKHLKIVCLNSIEQMKNNHIVIISSYIMNKLEAWKNKNQWEVQ